MDKNIALVIIDVQNDLVSESLYRGEQFISNVAGLIDKARRAGVPVIYIQHTEADETAMGKGKEGWQIHPKVKPLDDETVILKYTPDSFHKTSLHEELSGRGIKNLVLAGLQTEYCVDTTCRRAFSLGYNVTLVRDAHSTYDSSTLTAAQIINHHNRVLGGCFAALKSAEEIVF